MGYDKAQMADLIRETLMEFVGVRSNTNSPMERGVEEFFKGWFEKVPYLKEHPEYCGFFPIPGDYLDRHVSWCMLKGQGNDTIVMVHHNDCVETVEFGNLEGISLKPVELMEAYKKGLMDLPQDAVKDLNSGEWLFGRGVSDMKGGGSIQLSLFAQYSKDADFKGNIVIISVPDEENLSAGMRGAALLLKQLQKKYSLEYKLMLNCEPHEREDANTPTLYDGSVGKILPIVYVRGKLAHVGQVFKGLNPSNLLSEIVRRSELNTFFMDKGGNTVSPPATWLYVKDRKMIYDVSLPIGASGCLSVLPLIKTPKEIMDKLQEICIDSFDAVIADMNKSYRMFAEASGLGEATLPWKTRVLTYGELFKEALRDSGDAFKMAYGEHMASIKKRFNAAEISVIESCNILIERTLDFVKDTSPVVVIGLVPPYYPSVCNDMLSGEIAESARALTSSVVAYGKELTGMDFCVQNYFTGISDLSYAMFEADDVNISYIENNMIMWGDIYDIPLSIIRELSMPVMNIGPWGKDLHKISERVYTPDLYEITPQMVDFAVRTVFNQ